MTEKEENRRQQKPDEEKSKGSHADEMIRGALLARAKASALAPTNRTRLLRTTAAVIVLITAVTTLALTGQLNSLIFRPSRMAWVEVPEGIFQMGNSSKAGDMVGDDEFPQHTVYLDFYKIGKYEVTNKQYLRCVKAGACAAPSSQRYKVKEYKQHPVTNICWYDAEAFCEWSGGRLPTEAEWEKASRGTDSMDIAWGEGIDYWQLHYGYFIVGDAEPVGSFPERASQYGALDMEGNVWEWVADWYGSGYYAISPYQNPEGASSGDSRVIRGAWDNVIRVTRSASRDNRLPDYRNYNLGFRCVKGKTSQ